MATLAETIDLLRPFGPSVLLVRCLVLAQEFKEAREISKVLAPLESARLAQRIDEPVSDTAELRLRNIFCQAVAGSHRNARLVLGAFIQQCEARRGDAAFVHTVATQLAIGAIIVNDDDLTERVLALIRDEATLVSRMLKAWFLEEPKELDGCVTEIQSYVRDADIPIWSDTWHHLLLEMHSGRLVFWEPDGRK